MSFTESDSTRISPSPTVFAPSQKNQRCQRRPCLPHERKISSTRMKTETVPVQSVWVHHVDGRCAVSPGTTNHGIRSTTCRFSETEDTETSIKSIRAIPNQRMYGVLTAALNPKARELRDTYRVNQNVICRVFLNRKV